MKKKENVGERFKNLVTEKRSLLPTKPNFLNCSDRISKKKKDSHL